MSVNILYQFNEKYAPYACVSITSLFENNSKADSITVYILGEGLSEDSKDRLRGLGDKYTRTIIFKETSDIIYTMKQWGIPSYRGSYAANLRLFLPLFLENDVERILYIDSDTIIASSLDELYGIEMKECALGMAIDSLGYRYKQTIGFHKDEQYYNSGVILFDLNNWRKNEWTERIIQHIKDGNVNYSSPDQDLLNVVCKGNIKCIDLKYNMQPVHLVFRTKDYFRCYPRTAYYSEDQIDNAVRHVVIYHFFRFLGEFPWNKGNLHPDNNIFDKYLELSPWKEYQKQKSESGMVMKTERLLFRILPRSIFLIIFSMFHNLYSRKRAEISTTI